MLALLRYQCSITTCITTNAIYYFICYFIAQFGGFSNNATIRETLAPKDRRRSKEEEIIVFLSGNWAIE